MPTGAYISEAHSCGSHADRLSGRQSSPIPCRGRTDAEIPPCAWQTPVADPSCGIRQPAPQAPPRHRVRLPPVRDVFQAPRRGSRGTDARGLSAGSALELPLGCGNRLFRYSL